MVRSEVVGTVRDPAGDAEGVIAGLIIKQGADLFMITKSTAITMAMAGLLWSHVPGDGRVVDVEAIDRDGDRIADYVRTVPDHTRQNNLLALPIWVWNSERNLWVRTVRWFSPFLEVR